MLHIIIYLVTALIAFMVVFLPKMMKWPDGIVRLICKHCNHSFMVSIPKPPHHRRTESFKVIDTCPQCGERVERRFSTGTKLNMEMDKYA